MKLVLNTKEPSLRQRRVAEKTNWPEWTWPNLEKCSRNDYHPLWLPCGPERKTCPLCAATPQEKELDEQMIARVREETDGHKGTDWDTVATYRQTIA